MSAPKFEPCPQDIKDAVCRAEAERTGESYEDLAEHSPVVGLVRGYMTEGPGFVGDVVVIIWPAGPGAVTIYGCNRMTKPGTDHLVPGKWEFQGQTSW